MNKLTYATYDDMWKVCRAMVPMLPLSIDAVAGVPSSGLAPAGMIACLLRVPCVPIEQVPAHVRHLLVLEDSTQGMRFKSKYAYLSSNHKVVWGAVYASGRAITELDVHGVLATKPRIWQWNLFKHILTPKIAYDLDGVFCRDPYVEENDDGGRYRKFCLTVPSLVRGGVDCRAIVTNRLERFRPETEAWLKMHKIKFKELVMSQHKSAKERRTAKDYAEHKASWYGKSDAILFVESDPGQAAKIAELTGKPVVAVEGFAWNVKAALPCDAPIRQPVRQPGPVGIPSDVTSEVMSEVTPEVTPEVAPDLAVQEVKKNRKIMYAIATGYHSLNPPVFENVPKGWDTYVVTDKDCPDGLSAKEKATWAKCHGPMIFKDYDVSLCMDDDFTKLRSDPDLHIAAEWSLCYAEPWGTVKKDIHGLVVNKIVDPRLAAIDTERFGHLRNRITGMMYRQHTEKVIEVCKKWWELYHNVATRRDQPALAQAFVDCNFTPTEFSNATRKKVSRHDKWRQVRHGWRIAYDMPRPSMGEMAKQMQSLVGLSIDELKLVRGLKEERGRGKHLSYRERKQLRKARKRTRNRT